MNIQPCPPPTPKPCPQICPPPPPPPPCYVKPDMREPHWKSLMGHFKKSIIGTCIAGVLAYIMLEKPRREAYAEWHRRAEIGEMGDEMARKGLFQAVSNESLKD